MSDYKKARQSSLPTEDVQNGSVGSDLGQDQVIIAPEIMSMILENLDFRSLKQVRLVCKSWLLEAQVHMESRGIIRFSGDTSTRRIREFEDLRRDKVRDLPQPFHFLDLDLYMKRYTLEWFMKQIFSNRSSPLALARFSTESFDVDLAIRLIIEHSSSLEYLKLARETFNYIHTLPEEQMFPKLRHLVVEDKKDVDEVDIYAAVYFPYFVGNIVKGSPNLETFESKNKAEPEGRELLRGVDITNIKKLNLDYEDPKESMIDYFLAIPFGQLQNLKLVQNYDDSELPWRPLEIVTTCAATLRVLDLRIVHALGDLSELPICPNLQKLLLFSFPEQLNILAQRFPSLQVLEVDSIDVDFEDDLWTEQSPFPGLKTLRVLDEYFQEQSDNYDKFFEKLPGVGCLSLTFAAVLRYCRLNASGKPRFSKIVQGLKHLEIQGPYAKDVHDEDDVAEADDTDYSLLATLKGVEIITLLDSNEALLRIPVNNMPGLKVLQFPWGAHHSLAKLLALARRMEKLVITNCCSYPRVGNPWSNEALNSFFDSAPNVVCGCKG